MFRFADHQAFFYLWLIPIISILGILLMIRSRKRIENKLGLRMAPFLTSSVSKTKRNLKLALEILTVTFFVIALARPQLGSALQEMKSEGIEIVLMVDVSKSMLAEDAKPSRLEETKIEMKRLLDKLSGDKVALVAFAGSAFVISPLTTDYSAIKMFLDSLSPESISTQGTVFKFALDEAYGAFKRGGSDPDEVAVTRVIVIASDGEDHEEGALTLAKKYSDEGVKIFSLGVGTAQGAPIPVRDEQGNLSGYLKDGSGKIVLTTHHSDFLVQLSEAGGGTYFHIGDGGNDLDPLLKRLSQLQKSQFESKMTTEFDERFQLFLMIGILLGLLELLLGDRVKGNIIWRGRLLSKMAAAFLIFGFYPVKSHALTPSIIKENNKAADAIKDDRPIEAYKILTQSLVDAPFQPEVHLNLGYAFEKNEEKDKAVSEYLGVAKSYASPEQRFQAYFNAARLKGEMKKVDEALDLYQHALEINPDSMEVKTNIELLLSNKNGGGEGESKDKDKDQKNQKDQKNPKDSKDDDKKDDKKEQDKKEQDKQGKQPEKQRPKPQPFNSKDLSERDVKNILEELRRQEDKIRGKMYEDKPHKENPSGPDW